MTTAQEALATGRGVSKKLEASGLLMVGEAQPSTPESLKAAKEALAAFKALGDPIATGAASLAYVSCLLAQEKPQPDEGLAAAKEALAMFKEKACTSGEGAALSMVSLSQHGNADATEAEKMAREALGIFRESE